MKICILIHDLIPYSLKASAKMIHDLANEISFNGHEVTIILPAPELKSKYEKIVNGKITIYRFKTGEFENVSKIKRAINETFLSYNAWKNLKNFFLENRHDYIIYYSPTVFWGRLVGRLKKIWNAKTYLILRDFFPQWLIDNGILRKRSIITKYFLFFENLNYKYADRIGVQSPNNLKWFIENKKVKAEVELLYNWVTDSPFQKDGSNFYRKKLNLFNKVIFVYGGNMGPAQDMNNIINLAKRLLEYPEAHILMVGSGYEVKLIQEAIKLQNLNNITYLEPLEPNEYQKLLSESDIGLFCLNKNHKTHNFPGKVLGYLVQGLPILGCVNSGNDLIDIINSSNAGLISVSGDDEKFFKNAVFLLNSKNRIEMGKNSKFLLKEKFSVETAYNKIISAIK